MHVKNVFVCSMAPSIDKCTLPFCRACRALALGCGGYLAELRDCWSDTKQIASGKGGERSCRDIQIDMSRCVNKRAAELAERMQKSKKQ